MHNSYWFLSHLSKRLNEVLAGFKVVSGFSQNKDELILEFNDGQKSIFVRAHLQSNFSCLSFPSAFKRARKNSIELFAPLSLREVLSVKQFENERCFAIEFEGGLSLYFKMFGNQSNIILTMDGAIAEIFRKNIKSDATFNFHSLKEDTNPVADAVYYLVEVKGTVRLVDAPTGKVLKEFNDPFQAINEFFYQKVSGDQINKEKGDALKALTEKEKQTTRYLAKTRSELAAQEADEHNQLWGDLIMANLHEIKKGVDKVLLKDFSSDLLHEIKLKKEVSPQQNAAIYYRKAKNKKLEIEKLRAAIRDKEMLLTKIRETKSSVENAGDAVKVNQIIQESGLASKSRIHSERLPYRAVEFNDYSIWIGRTANDNDELTLKYAHKEDLWLHAKDVSGSHVVIKHKSGTNFPKSVIERAAQLAAFHSKRKGESLCPVAYTAKKFVRKRKGDPPGMVVVEKEKVILVEPTA